VPSAERSPKRVVKPHGNATSLREAAHGVQAARLAPRLRQYTTDRAGASRGCPPRSGWRALAAAVDRPAAVISRGIRRLPKPGNPTAGLSRLADRRCRWMMTAGSWSAGSVSRQLCVSVQRGGRHGTAERGERRAASTTCSPAGIPFRQHLTIRSPFRSHSRRGPCVP
jgi:hypothetical protein